MPHSIEELWLIISAPIYLVLAVGIALLMTVTGLRYRLNRTDLARRQGLVKYLLACHFLYWGLLALTCFLFLECMIHGDTFGLVEYSLLGLRIAIGLPILVAFIGIIWLAALRGQRLPQILLSDLDAIPAPEAIQRLVVDLSLRTGMDPPRVIIEKSSVTSSMTIYGRPPVILLSQGLLELFTPDELRAVIAHEIAHIANNDGQYKLVTSILSRFFYFDPLIKLLKSSLCRDREFLADELSARVTEKPLDLATALLKIHRHTAHNKQPFRNGFSSFAINLIGGSEALTMTITGVSGKWRTDHPPLKERIRRLLKLHHELNCN